MSALLVANYKSARRYGLAVDILPPYTNGFTCLPFYSAASNLEAG